MSTFKLDDIRAAADRKYGTTDIEIGDQVVHLVNPLRLSESARDEFSRLSASMKDDDEKDESESGLKRQVERLEALLRCVAASVYEGDLLIDAVGGDLAVLAEVFEAYGEKEQVGEASPSRD